MKESWILADFLFTGCSLEPTDCCSVGLKSAAAPVPEYPPTLHLRAVALYLPGGVPEMCRSQNVEVYFNVASSDLCSCTVRSSQLFWG